MAACSAPQGNSSVCQTCQDIGDQLACPVDFELLTRAVTLYCGHTFNDGPDLARQCACPICREKIGGKTPAYLVRDLATRALSTQQPRAQDDLALISMEQSERWVGLRPRAVSELALRELGRGGGEYPGCPACLELKRIPTRLGSQLRVIALSCVEESLLRHIEFFQEGSLFGCVISFHHLDETNTAQLNRFFQKASLSLHLVDGTLRESETCAYLTTPRLLYETVRVLLLFNECAIPADAGWLLRLAQRRSFAPHRICNCVIS